MALHKQVLASVTRRPLLRRQRPLGSARRLRIEVLRLLVREGLYPVDFEALAGRIVDHGTLISALPGASSASL